MPVKETWILFACLILISCKKEENSSGRNGDVTRDKRNAHSDVAIRKIRNSDRNGGDGDNGEDNAYRELLEKQNDMIMEDLREVLQVTGRSTDFDDAKIDRMLIKGQDEDSTMSDDKWSTQKSPTTYSQPYQITSAT